MNTIEVFVDADIIDVMSVHCDMSLDCLNTMNNDLLSVSEDLFPQDGVYTMEVIFHPAEYYKGGLVNGSWYDFKQIDYKSGTARDDLFETCVRCETFEEYQEVYRLYLEAGCNIWPWHTGFKPYDKNDDELNDCPYYGWEHCGFLKHIRSKGSRKELSIHELKAFVRKYR
jgi:hypothetical protein